MVYVLGMTSPGFKRILQIYQSALTVGVLEHFQKQAGLKIRRGVYSAQVVMWLMILQRLHEVGTLTVAVQMLIQGMAAPLLQNCLRVQKKRISARTGGYSQARQRLPAVLCRNVMKEITLKLRAMLGLEDEARVYLLDGSSLELEHCPELMKSYPPAQNQHGASHWPVLRIVVLHELEIGLAEEPQWGAMYGGDAVSEQKLAAQAMDGLPRSAVLLGDRNFGVLWMAHEAHQRGLGVVLRLTEIRARKLWGGPITQPGEQEVVWKASRGDGGKDHSLPAQAEVKGRLIAALVGRGKSKKWLYLFTTQVSPAEELVALYGSRYKIETDLRSLKRTVRLHHVTVRSKDMLDKELLMAVCAYNLVRAVICLAARNNRIEPRQLSFAMVLNVVNCAWPKLAAATTPEEFQNEFARVLELAAQCTLPKRSRHRSYPRAVHRHRPGFPYMREKTK